DGRMGTSLRRRSSAPTVIDLFAGAGLFSHAFAAEGFDVVCVIELDEVAAASYALNLGDHVVISDRGDPSPEGECGVLFAGPTCQGCSTCGTRDPNDPRILLGLEVVRWAAGCKPSIVVVENVAAFLGAPVWKLLVAGLEALGYEVSAQVVDAVEFGVPQRRQRSFTFASKVGIPTLEKPVSPGDVSVRAA